MQPAGEFNVAVDACFGTDQGVDLRILILILIPFEHLRHPWQRDWGWLRFRPTCPAPSTRRPVENCGWHLYPCRYESPLRPASVRIPAAVVRVRRNPESNGRSMPGSRAGSSLLARRGGWWVCLAA